MRKVGCKCTTVKANLKVGRGFQGMPHEIKKRIFGAAPSTLHSGGGHCVSVVRPGEIDILCHVEAGLEFNRSLCRVCNTHPPLSVLRVGNVIALHAHD
jgi:hypothetical protein